MEAANGLGRSQSGFGCVLYESLGVCLYVKNKINRNITALFPSGFASFLGLSCLQGDSLHGLHSDLTVWFAWFLSGVKSSFYQE